MEHALATMAHDILDRSESAFERYCHRVRLDTPTIPDIDLTRYICPECGKTVGSTYGGKHPWRCQYCGQHLDWGFLT